MQKFRLKLNLQLFSDEDEELEVVEEHNVEPEEVITDENLRHNGSGHNHSPHNLGPNQALDDAQWKQFLELQKMQNEKVDQHLSDLVRKLDELDSRHQAIPASIREQLDELFNAHVASGNIKDDGEVKKKSSKYSRH